MTPILLLAMLSTAAGAPQQRPEVALAPVAGAALPADVLLADDAGLQRPLSQWLDGRPAVLVFGYLSCPDICPLTMSDIALALDELSTSERARVSVALVTVDPDRDTGPEIAADQHHFLAATPEVGVHGLRTDGMMLANAGGRLNARWDVAPHERGAEVYDVSHTAVTYAVDDAGLLLREWPFGTTPDAIARTLRALLSDQKGARR